MQSKLGESPPNFIPLWTLSSDRNCAVHRISRNALNMLLVNIKLEVPYRWPQQRYGAA